MASLPSSTELEKLKVPDLKKLCKEHNVTGYSKMKKQEMVDKLKAVGGTGQSHGPSASSSSAQPILNAPQAVTIAPKPTSTTTSKPTATAPTKVKAPAKQPAPTTAAQRNQTPSTKASGPSPVAGKDGTAPTTDAAPIIAAPHSQTPMVQPIPSGSQNQPRTAQPTLPISTPTPSSAFARPMQPTSTPLATSVPTSSQLQCQLPKTNGKRMLMELSDNEEEELLRQIKKKRVGSTAGGVGHTRGRSDSTVEREPSQMPPTIRSSTSRLPQAPSFASATSSQGRQGSQFPASRMTRDRVVVMESRGMGSRASTQTGMMPPPARDPATMQSGSQASLASVGGSYSQMAPTASRMSGQQAIAPAITSSRTTAANTGAVSTTMTSATSVTSKSSGSHAGKKSTVPSSATQQAKQSAIRLPVMKPPAPLQKQGPSKKAAVKKKRAAHFIPLKINHNTVPATSRLPSLVPVESEEPSLCFGDGAAINDIKKALKKSWLERMFLASGHRASEDLAFNAKSFGFWKRSGSTPALDVALRFAIARIHTTFQLGRLQNPTLLAPVTACYQATGGLWTVITEEKVEVTRAEPTKAPKKRSLLGDQSEAIKDTKLERVAYLVIGETGDVVSNVVLANEVDQTKLDTSKIFSLRDDWSTYTMTARGDQPVLTEAGDSASLLACLKTKRSDDVERGISMAWRTRAKTSDLVGEMRVAERYILSNVVLESVSGTLQSAMQMDTTWTGHGALSLPQKARRSLELYLPESHQVESVSFNTRINRNPTQLHSSIAIVARRSTEDIILRNTGQVIGSVDGEGVSELYQRMLGCDHRGIALSTVNAVESAKEFWGGWEERLTLLLE